MYDKKDLVAKITEGLGKEAEVVRPEKLVGADGGVGIEEF